ncbi:uncharacterized protein LOC8076155 [Sorghum bicolor]|uniref:DUF569 domain-containing protein n=1 Tax=Sorghum bicolor TaxID=4558 RepID=C5Z4Y1_SORBI|nr:uncharacterized protein LOC8076155 [Sorghum bicolor]EER89273.1 hypothetical protein SORBI_3010G053300 [Sorghum bicolor]|eukprot:XP_002437906.1 uncharacterized protein LOC8076155 [Sorghum bicolor]
MEKFPDGAHLRLRLRSRVHGGGGGGGGCLYLDADEDGVGVSLREHRASLSVAWRVHRVQHGGATRVLLHGAAYGRYLAVRPANAPPPGLRARRACRAVQCVYDAPEQDDVLWEAVDAGDDDGGSGDVLLRHHRYGLWYDNGEPSTTMRWVIEPIPPKPEPPALPAPSPSVGGLRRIRYVRADDDGNFAQIGWGTFDFCGQSVYRLRGEVSIKLAEPFASIGMTLCVRAGLCGRLTLLVTDLPRSQEPMDVVVLTTGSPAAEALVYPDADA